MEVRTLLNIYYLIYTIIMVYLGWIRLILFGIKPGTLGKITVVVLTVIAIGLWPVAMVEYFWKKYRKINYYFYFMLYI